VTIRLGLTEVTVSIPVSVNPGDDYGKVAYECRDPGILTATRSFTDDAVSFQLHYTGEDTETITKSIRLRHTGAAISLSSVLNPMTHPST